MSIAKHKKLSQEELKNRMIDVTKQPIEGPKKDHKPYYSAKKKRHTLKTEMREHHSGRIVQISPSYLRIHSQFHYL